MHDADSRIRALILAYEDLDEEDRQKADDFLARNPEFRLQLARLQQLEALAREPIPTDLGDASRETTLSAEDEEQLARSLEALLKRLGLSETASAALPVASTRVSDQLRPASASRVPRRASRRSWLPLAAVALLLLIVWAPWSGRSPVQFRDAIVIAVDATTRTTRAPENGDSWKSGEAFALSFRLEASAHVAVYHVDPTGRVSLVVPESRADPMPYFETGATHQIPSAMGNNSGFSEERLAGRAFCWPLAKMPSWTWRSWARRSVNACVV